MRRISRSDASASSIADSVISSFRFAGERSARASADEIVVEQARVAELAAREVDAQVDRPAVGLVRPRARLPARLLEHEPAERHDQPALLGDADEVRRGEPAALRVVPADEGLHLDRQAAAQVEDRLVDDRDLRRRRWPGGARPPARGATRRGPASPARSARSGPCRRSSPRTSRRRRGPARRRRRRPRRRPSRPRCSPSRRPRARCPPAGRAASRTRSATSAAWSMSPTSSSRTANSSPRQAAGRVARPDRAASRRATSTSSRSPDAVAERVVDVLEVVEVDQQHRGHRPAAPAAGQRVADAVGEQGAVGEPGQRVVERLVAELRLEVGPLGDVVRVDDQPADGRIVEQVVRGPVEGEPSAVAMEEPGLADDLPVRALGDGGEMAREDVAVVGVDPVGEPPPDAILRPVARATARRPRSRTGSGRPDRRRRTGRMRAGPASGSVPRCRPACRSAGGAGGSGGRAGGRCHRTRPSAAPPGRSRSRRRSRTRHVSWRRCSRRWPPCSDRPRRRR